MIPSPVKPSGRMFRAAIAFTIVATLVGTAGAALAQQVNIGGYDKLTVYTQEKLGDKHYLFKGSVELERGDTTIYADSVEYFEDEDRAPMHALNEIIWKSVMGADSPMPPPVHRYRALIDAGL